MKANERLQAVKILVKLLNTKASLSYLMSSIPDLTPLSKELCFGFCRHYLRVQQIAARLMDKKPKAVDVWVLILLGLYQLEYMDLPEYAVVQETVGVLTKLKKIWAKGLVNAVLRQYCRRRGEILALLAQDEVFIYGQPQWLLEHIQVDWPDNWGAIAKANDQHPPMTLRVNIQEKSVQEYLALLEQEHMQGVQHPIIPTAVLLDKPCAVQELPGFIHGWVSVQDAAAQIAMSLLDLQPGLRVLDACCAPGGKTCHILETEPNLATCVAVDVDDARLRKVKENLQRLQLQAELIVADALNPESWWDKTPFDRILLDAPCSATGVIRRHADIKLLRTAEEIQAVQVTQESMLHALWPLLAKGGIMVYATCSVIAAENEQQIAKFVAAHNDCTVKPMNYSWGHATGHGLQILPGENDMDGFFYSVLVKSPYTEQKMAQSNSCP